MHTYNDPLKNKKLNLKYPCKWSYTLILKNDTTKNNLEVLLKNNVETLLKTNNINDFNLEKNNTSKNNTFTSYIVSCILISQKQRLSLLECFKNLDNISMVL